MFKVFFYLYTSWINITISVSIISSLETVSLKVYSFCYCIYVYSVSQSTIVPKDSIDTRKYATWVTTSLYLVKICLVMSEKLLPKFYKTKDTSNQYFMNIEHS